MIRNRKRITILGAILFLGSFLGLGIQSGLASEGLQVGEELTIAAEGPGGNLRGTPAISYGKDAYLVVWREGQILKSSHASICATRVDSNGKLLDSKFIEVAPCKDPCQERPRVAYANSIFLIVWQDFRGGKDFDILGARMSSEGKLLDAQPIAIAAGARTQVLPDITADSSGFYVTWQGFMEHEDACRTFVTRVETDGRVGQPAVLDFRSDPKIASNGKELLVVFGTPHDPAGGSNHLQCMRLGTDCKPLSQPLRLGNRAEASVCGVPGKGWVVVHDRAKPDHWGWGGPGAMICVSIEPDGKPEANIPQMPSGNWEKMANWLDVTSNDKKFWPFGPSSITWDGKRCISVWTRWQMGGATGINLTNGNIVASRVDGWKPLDSEGVFIANTDVDERLPALASNGSGHLLCVYEKKLQNGKVVVAARTIKDE